MTGLEHLFEQPRRPSHPSVRYWRGLLDEHKVSRLCVEILREDPPLALEPARMLVHLYDGADREVAAPEELDWDSRIEDELLALGVPALDRDHEALRFGLVLRSRFSIVESRFDDGFFNAVLAHHLRRGGFAAMPAVRDLLDEVDAPRARPGKQMELCVEMIEDVLRSCIDSLHRALAYSREQTIAIASGAIAAHLDERFGVSQRRALGMS